MLCIGQLTHPATGSEQSLGGHTAAVHTSAAHITGFKDSHLEAMLGCMFGCVETAISGADHNHIEVETGVVHPIFCVEDVILARRLSRRRGTAATATFRDSTAELWGKVTP